LDEFDFRRRKPQKVKTMNHDPHRNAQFETMTRLKAKYHAAGHPVLSMDGTKREILGDDARPGRALSTGPSRAWDHGFRTHCLGVAIPHGLYGLDLNEGYITWGTMFRGGSTARGGGSLNARRQLLLEGAIPYRHPDAGRKTVR
jgi:hypothetical protein